MYDKRMADYRDDDFEWDLEKAANNLLDHNVSFYEACLGGFSARVRRV